MNNGATPNLGTATATLYPLLLIAPDIARGSELIAYPPRFGPEPSRAGRLSIFLRGTTEDYTYNGYVTRIARLGDVALVEVLDDRTAAEIGDDPLLYEGTPLEPQSSAYLVRSADLPPMLSERAVHDS